MPALVRAANRHRHTVVVDSLKALDPERPIREVDIMRRRAPFAFIAVEHIGRIRINNR